jgi:hypothetical protein
MMTKSKKKGIIETLCISAWNIRGLTYKEETEAEMERTEIYFEVFSETKERLKSMKEFEK